MSTTSDTISRIFTASLTNNPILQSKTDKSFYYSIAVALGNGDMNKFAAAAEKINDNDTLNIRYNSAIFFLDGPAEGTNISKITSTSGSSFIMQLANGSSLNVNLPVKTLPNTTTEGKQAQYFVSELLNGQNISVNIIVKNLDGSYIADINTGAGSTSSALAATTFGNPQHSSTMNIYSQSYAGDEPGRIIPSQQTLQKLYDAGVKETPISHVQAQVKRELDKVNEKLNNTTPTKDKEIKIGKNFNDRASDSFKKGYINSFYNTDWSDSEDNGLIYTLKIGDVILKIPPTHLSISQMRNSLEEPMIGFPSMSSASPVTRITFKINCIFTQSQIDDDLKRLITQFTYCPFNIIHSIDLYNLLITEESSLAYSLSSQTFFPCIPVTMDEYNIYTLEGHPNSVGCAIQCSLFNYMAYFDGKDDESIKYTKAEFSEDGTLSTAGTDIGVTQHLEEAIHPYNFDIINILKSENNKWNFSPFDVNNTYLSDDSDDDSLSSQIKIYKLTSFEDINAEITDTIVKDSEIYFLCDSMSIRFENQFSWFPIVGYSHAIPQYVGPGSTAIAISAKTSFDDVSNLNRLFSTYHESRSFDRHAMYDGRYYIESSLTRLTDSLIVNISDIAVTSIPNHPGFSDINLTMKKSPYISTTLYSNKVADKDLYFGMRRIASVVEQNEQLQALVNAALTEEKATIEKEYSYAGKIANKNGYDIGNVAVGLVDILNNAIKNILTTSDANAVNKAIVDNHMKFISTGIKANDVDGFINMLSKVTQDIYNGTSDEAFMRDLPEEDGSRVTNRLYPLSKMLKIAFKDNIAKADETLQADIRTFFLECVLKYPFIFNGLNDVSTNFNHLAAEFVSGKTNEVLFDAGNFQIKNALQSVFDKGNINKTYDIFNIPVEEIKSRLKETKKYLHITIDACTTADTCSPLVTTDNRNAFANSLKKAIEALQAKSVGAILTFDKDCTVKSLVATLSVAERDANKTVAVRIKAVVDDASSEKKIDLSSLSSIQIKPMAAHRYYPNCEAFVSQTPLMSMCVGGYFYSKYSDTSQYATHFIGELKDSLKHYISPLMNNQAWKSMFPQGSDAAKLLEKENPLNTARAIVYPSLRKDLLAMEDLKIKNSGLPELGLYSASALSAGGANDRPFTGYTDWIFLKEASLGKDAWGSPMMQELSLRMTSPTVTQLSDSNQTSPDAITLDRGAVAVITAEGDLARRSLTTPLALSGIGDEDKGYSSDVAIEHKTKGMLQYLRGYYTATKSPSDQVIATSAASTVPAPNVSSSSTTQEEDYESKSIAVLKATLSASDNSFVKASLKYISSTGDQTYKFIYRFLYLSSILPEDVLYSQITAGLKNALSESSGYHYVQLSDFLFGKPIPTSHGINNWELCNVLFDALLILKIGKFAADNETSQGPAVSAPYDASTRAFKSFIQLGAKEVPIYIKGNFKSSTLQAPAFLNANNSSFYKSSDIKEKLSALLKQHFSEVDLTPLTYYSSDNKFKKILLVEIITPLINVLRELTTFVNETYEEDTGEDTEEDKDSDSSTGSTTDSPESVDSNIAGSLISQFTSGLLPTHGLQNAFPTYKMYIIQSNTSELRFYTLDDWYDFRLVQDLMVIKSKNDPDHLLKARVIVDDRFITTNILIPRDNDRNWIEHRDPSPTLGTAGVFDSAFYGGKAPLRPGMRICIKLGYHTDPRLLDTVFIGTITGLREGMEKGVYELEAHGDGRELSSPASASGSKIKGRNYSEIITKMLRSNPAVFHLGRNYGSTIERFTREHQVIYGLGKAFVDGGLDTFKDTMGVLSFGTNKGYPALAGTGLLAGSLYLAAGVTSAPVALAATAVGAAGFYGYNVYKKLNQNNWTDKFYSEIEQSFDSFFTANSVNDSLFHYGAYFRGQTYDMSKASGQVFKHMFDTYKYGNDPVDDNIWAVDIWQNFVEAGNSVSINPTNNTSIWDILVGIKRLYPNYALDVRPYGARSTLYFGPYNWCMWRTDDPILAMLSGINETSNENYLKALGQLTSDLDKRNILMETTTNNSMPPLVDFQRSHLASSNSNIIFNGITSTPDRGWNYVIVNAGGEQYDTKANAELHPGTIRTRVEAVSWTSDGSVAQQYALGLLKEGVEKMYGGTLVLRGNPKVEPYDRLYVCDHIQKMYGWVEVETVIHKFDRHFGFTTHIVPNMLCAVNNDAYKTNAQLLRSFMTSGTTAKLALQFVSGVAIGAAVTAGLAALGPPGWVIGALTLFGAASFLYSATTATITTVQTMTGIVKNNSRVDEYELLQSLQAAHMAAASAESINRGMEYGLVLGYLRLLYKTGWYTLKDNAKGILKDSWSTSKNVFFKMWRSDFPLFRVFEAGRYGQAIIGNTNSLVAKINKSIPKGATRLQFDAAGINAADASSLAKIINTLDDVDSLIQEVEQSTALDDSKKAKLVTELKGRSVEIRAAINSADKATLAAKPAKILPVNAHTGWASLRKVVGRGMAASTMMAVVDGIAAIPMVFETLVVNYMTKANCLSISPLICRNILMIAGVDGFQYSNAFLHIKNMAINAKRVLDDADRAAMYNLPKIPDLIIRDIPTTNRNVADAAQKNKVTVKPASSAVVPAGYSTTISKHKFNVTAALQKYNARITALCDPVKSIFNEKLILTFIEVESGGDSNVVNPTSGATGLMQLVPSAHYDRMIRLMEDSSTSEKDKLKECLKVTFACTSKYNSKNNSTELKTLQKYYKDNPNKNIEAGVEYLLEGAEKTCAEIAADSITSDSDSILNSLAAKYLNGDPASTSGYQAKIKKLYDNYDSAKAAETAAISAASNTVEQTVDFTTKTKVLSLVQGEVDKGKEIKKDQPGADSQIAILSLKSVKVADTNLYQNNGAPTNWCAAYVYYSLERQNNSTIDSKLNSTQGLSFAKNWENFGTATTSPAPGDIVVLKPEQSGTTGHVGFFVEKTAEGKIRVISGNGASGTVHYTNYNPSSVSSYRSY